MCQPGTKERSGRESAMKAAPSVVRRDFWARAIDFDFLVEEGGIDRNDIALFEIVDGSEQTVQIVHDFYGGRPPE